MAFYKSAPKVPEEEKVPFISYEIHSQGYVRAWKEKYRQVVSIDPAVNNFAFRIEQWHVGGKVIPVAFEKADFKQYVTTNSSCLLYLAIIQFLDKYLKQLKESHIIIIERQPPLKVANIRLMQHLVTYFALTLRDVPLYPMVLDIDPRLKGKQLDAPKNLNEKALKEWSVEKAVEILKMRGDEWSLGVINFYKKKDDLADTICQVEAFFRLTKLWPIDIVPVKPKMVIAMTILHHHSKDESQ